MEERLVDHDTITTFVKKFARAEEAMEKDGMWGAWYVRSILPPESKTDGHITFYRSQGDPAMK